MTTKSPKATLASTNLPKSGHIPPLEMLQSPVLKVPTVEGGTVELSEKTTGWNKEVMGSSPSLQRAPWGKRVLLAVPLLQLGHSDHMIFVKLDPGRHFISTQLPGFLAP